MGKINQTSYHDHINDLNRYIALHRSHTSEIIKLFNDELVALLSAHKKNQAQYTIHQLTLFEEKVVRPYINMYLMQYGVDNADVIKKLQSIKEQVMCQQYTFKTYIFTKQVDDTIKSKNVASIEGKLRYLEELFWTKSSSRSQIFILQQAEKCINELPLSEKSLREQKFKNNDPQTGSTHRL